MGTRAKKRPEFELPAVLIKAIEEYFGQRAINKLSSAQATKIADICNDTAGAIGQIFEDSKQPVRGGDLVVDEKG